MSKCTRWLCPSCEKPLINFFAACCGELETLSAPIADQDEHEEAGHSA